MTTETRKRPLGGRRSLKMFQRMVPVTALAAALSLIACFWDRDRDRAIKKAVEDVKNTMSVAAPDLAHPQPYFSGESGQCSLPGWSSSKEKLRYQADLALPPGDDGLARQARAVRHWLDKGGELYQPSSEDVPSRQVDHEDGSVQVYVSPASDPSEGPQAARILHIVATTRCIPKEE